MFQENSIEICILSRVKQITSPGWIKKKKKNVVAVVVQLLSCVWLSATPRTAACQASLSITNSWSLLKLMSIESVMPPNHLVLCHPFSSCPQSFSVSIRVFSNESTLHITWPKYWIFTFSISPSNEYSRLISFRTVWFDLLAVQGIPDTGIGDKNKHNHKICETKH